MTKEIEDHKGTRITALTWDDDSARLFIGDDRGIVTAVIVAPFKLVSVYYVVAAWPLLQYLLVTYQNFCQIYFCCAGYCWQSLLLLQVCQNIV